MNDIVKKVDLEPDFSRSNTSSTTDKLHETGQAI